MPAQQQRALVIDGGGQEVATDLYMILMEVITDENGRYIVDVTGRCRGIHGITLTVTGVEKAVPVVDDTVPVTDTTFRIGVTDELGADVVGATVKVMLWVEG